MDDRSGVSGWSAKFDGEEVSRNGGLAFGEGSLFFADCEFGGKKIVIGENEEAIEGEEG